MTKEQYRAKATELFWKDDKTEYFELIATMYWRVSTKRLDESWDEYVNQISDELFDAYTGIKL